MSKIKKFWNKLKYWQKGGIIGGIIALILVVILFIPENSNLGSYDLTGLIQEYILLPWIFVLVFPPFSCYSDCSRIDLIGNAILFVSYFFIIGALIGLIIGKTKKK